jgi:hypothetical protein
MCPPPFGLLSQAVMLWLIQKYTLNVVTELNDILSPAGWMLDDCIKGGCRYFLSGLCGFTVWGLSISSEPDLKSCVASVTDAMWLPKCLSQIYFVIAPRYSCANCYNIIKRTSPNCYVHMHTDTKQGFSVRDRLHNVNPTRVFRMGNMHLYKLNLLRIKLNM